MNENALKEIQSLDYERPLDTDYLDPRIIGLVENYEITGKNVLEIGTLDGFHACKLRNYGAYVTASDIRPSNLQRALYRSLYFGLEINFRLLDMEEMHKKIQIDEYDLVFHSGCFYHLSDPVKHLKDIAPLAKHIMLETHIANPERYENGSIKYGKEYFGTWYPEGNWNDLRAAKDQRKSFWLTRESLKELITDCGLEIEHVIYENQQNPHGERVAYLLRRL